MADQIWFKAGPNCARGMAEARRSGRLRSSRTAFFVAKELHFYHTAVKEEKKEEEVTRFVCDKALDQSPAYTAWQKQA